MPRFRPRSRFLNRISFALVIGAGLFGWLYASANWQPDPSEINMDALFGGEDWIDIIAGIIEDAIQTFQAITG